MQVIGAFHQIVVDEMTLKHRLLAEMEQAPAFQCIDGRLWGGGYSATVSYHADSASPEG